MVLVYNAMFKQEAVDMKEGHYLCLQGIFDEATNREFNWLDGKLQDAQLRSLGYYQESPWHFSLGVYFDVEPEELVAWVLEVAKNQVAITLRFNHIGLFPGTAFVQPAFSRPLRNLFDRLHEKYDDRHGVYLETAKQYGLFVPHVSLIFSYEELGLAIDVLREHFQPFYGKMSELLIYECVKRGDKSFPVGPVARIKLKNC